MTTISPSILASDFLNLQNEIESFNQAENLWFHLDAMDGHYVPNLTFGKTVLKNLQKITKHKLDAHFMVDNPEAYVKEYADIGIHNFSFHWESVTHHDRMINFVKEHYPSCGVALNPGTPHNVIPEYLLKKIDLVLIMSVNPGFGGQSFIEGVLEKVRFFKHVKESINHKLEIQVDGGVNNTNASMLIKNGVTNLVAGSYIFKNKQEDYLKAVESLR